MFGILELCDSAALRGNSVNTEWPLLQYTLLPLQIRLLMACYVTQQKCLAPVKTNKQKVHTI